MDFERGPRLWAAPQRNVHAPSARWRRGTQAWRWLNVALDVFAGQPDASPSERNRGERELLGRGPWTANVSARFRGRVRACDGSVNPSVCSRASFSSRSRSMARPAVSTFAAAPGGAGASWARSRAPASTRPSIHYSWRSAPRPAQLRFRVSRVPAHCSRTVTVIFWLMSGCVNAGLVPSLCRCSTVPIRSMGSLALK